MIRAAQRLHAEEQDRIGRTIAVRRVQNGNRQMSQRAAGRPNLARRFFAFIRAEGETHVDQREDPQVLRQVQVNYSALSWQFVIVLSLSSAIASFGLMADSTVAIVGAMLIAPLMKPILAYAYGVIAGDWTLTLRAALTLFLGVLLTMLVAGLMEGAVGLRGPTSEIMARTKPTLIDLGVAAAAGIAASLANIRRNIADTLPGVAIAVALVPPLCVTGIGFCLGAWSIAGGAALLFSVNLIAIILTASMVLVLAGYGSLQTASWLRLLVIFILACVLVIPLTAALRQLRADDLAQEIVEAHLHEGYRVRHFVHPSDLSRLDAFRYSDHVFVYVEFKAPQSAFPKEECRVVHRRLTAAFNTSVNLKVKLLLSSEIMIYRHRLPNGKAPVYGGDALVPRR